MFILEDGLAQLGAEEGQAPMDGRLEGSPANHTTIHVGWTDQLSGSNCPAYHTRAMVGALHLQFAQQLLGSTMSVP